MSPSETALPLESFATFGDLLKYLRRRARLTQREVAIAVGYSEAQISRLEQNLRQPDLATLTALFIPALYLEDEPEIVARLMELATQARGEEFPRGGVITFSHSVQQEVLEDVRSVEDHLLNNLPLQLTSFVGREREIAEIRRLLGGARLITLTGSGGCGKTRLALEVAKRITGSYRDGVWLIELASISEPNLVLQTVASILGIPETGNTRRISELTGYLRTKQVLLIVDNCEQIVMAAAQLAEEILRTCPRVQILVTSREILDLIGEVQFRVPSLSLVEEKSAGGNTHYQSEAVQLFVERAQAVLPSFVLTEEGVPAVTQICHLVDGLPLGIELASAKISFLSVEQIATRLTNSLQILRGGRVGLAHHQTLETTIQWSYDLLSEAERTLMQRLSVFLGGWTLEAAETIVSDSLAVKAENTFDLISQLINKSLIIVDWQPRTEARYRMLQTIREFASEKLRAAGEIERMRSRHFDYFLSLAQEARLFGNEKGKWLDRLETEHDNLRAALAWSLEKERVEKGTELILPTLDFYWFRGYSMEALDWMRKLLAIESPASSLRALLLQKIGWLTRAGGDFEKADALLKRALEMALEIGDKNRASWALMDLGRSARDQGDNRQAVTFFSQALTFAQESGEKRAIGVCLYNLAESCDLTGELDRSRTFWEEGLNILRAEGDPTHIAWGLEGLAGVAYLAKDFASAFKFHLESLKRKMDVTDKLGIAFSLEGLAQVLAAQSKYAEAAVLWGAGNHLRETLNVPLESSREHLYTSLIPQARQQIGDEAFHRAWKKGREMKLNEAIEFALNVDHY